MFGKTKRYELNKLYHTAKGRVIFLKYIETEEDDPKVEYHNIDTNEIIIDYYGTMYYKIVKQHKKLGIEIPQAVKYVYNVDSDRQLKFGIEMELVSPVSKYVLERELARKGIRISSPNSTHQVVSGWKIVHDGSIRCGNSESGFELVSPPSFDFTELEIVCNVLKELKIKTNQSCGLHVHHDISNLKRRQIIRIYDFYCKYENLINLMHKENRDSNSYCKSISRIIEDVRNSNTKEELLVKIAGKGNNAYYNNCRYYKINLRSFLYYGTIEFRHAGGSTSFDEIKDWILFTHKIIDRALEIENDIKPMEEMQALDYILQPASQYENMMKELKVYKLTDTYKRLYKRIEKRSRRIA